MEKRFQLRIAAAVGFFISFLFLAPAHAETPPPMNSAGLTARFDQLEARITELQNQLVEQDKKHTAEVAELKRKVEIRGPEEKTVRMPGPEAKGPKWLEGLSMGGDIRFRYEAFDQNEVTRDRNRFRYRLRWKIAKEISKDLDLGFRFISGSNTDPGSPNQTFTGDFTFKNIFIDQAYVRYRPSFLLDRVEHLKKVELGVGKLENPFLATSTAMVWDPDVMPEGAYQTLEFNFLGDRVRPFVNLGEFILQENATASDAELYGVQTGLRWTPPGFSKESDVQATHTFAYYDFSDYAIDSNFIANGSSLAFGNTRNGASPFLEARDFNVLQTYNELKFKIRNFPVKLFGDFAVNLADQAADPLGKNKGYEYGLRLGEAKKKGDWEATYYYAYIEPNAVVGAFSESDFGGGHADKRGSALQLKYKLTDSLKFGFNAYYVNNVVGADDLTKRFSTDLEWAF